jgi:hypothetical protein
MVAAMPHAGPTSAWTSHPIRTSGTARTGATGSTASTAAGGRVDDRLDPPVDAKHLLERFPEHLVASTPDEGVARAGVDQPDRQGVIVERGDLGVLAQHHPREASKVLHRFEDIRPHPADVGEAVA